jgi:hypothetical protein
MNAITTTGSADTGPIATEKCRPWRDVLAVHPAAELFPLMSEAELRELADDIKKHGLCEPVAIYAHEVIDGRNRLDALALLGRQICDAHGHLNPGIGFNVGDEWGQKNPFDPYAYVVSKNLQRRHLTAKDKRDVIAKLLAANPEKSNRQIAAAVGVDHKTVAAERAEGEARGEIPHVETTTDTKGRMQPAHKAAKPEPEPAPRVSPEDVAEVLTEAIEAMQATWREVAAHIAADNRPMLKEAVKRLHLESFDVVAALERMDTLPGHAATMLADGLPATFIRKPAGAP